MRPKIPPLPLGLGLGGLIPFWGLAVARIVGVGHLDPFLISFVLALYAATILAFLGGVRWGLAVASPDQAQVTGAYVVSVLPQLVGWASLALPDPWRLIVLALMLLVMGPIDSRLVTRGLAPPWFGRLRMILSLGAGAALLLAAFA